MGWVVGLPAIIEEEERGEKVEFLEQVDSVDDLLELPDMAVFIDADNTAGQVSRSTHGIFHAWAAGESTPLRGSDVALPVRVVWVKG